MKQISRPYFNNFLFRSEHFWPLLFWTQKSCYRVSIEIQLILLKKLQFYPSKYSTTSGYTFGLIPTNSTITKQFQEKANENSRRIKQAVVVLGSAPKPGDAIYKETKFLQSDGTYVCSFMRTKQLFYYNSKRPNSDFRGTFGRFFVEFSSPKIREIVTLNST